MRKFSLSSCYQSHDTAECLRTTLQSRECVTFISPDEDMADFKSHLLNINIKRESTTERGPVSEGGEVNARED